MAATMTRENLRKIIVLRFQLLLIKGNMKKATEKKSALLKQQPTKSIKQPQIKVPQSKKIGFD
ncbi:MAG: hypothetical protein IPH96_13480 [Saprospiraceae bacterium]|nr:hypothetical protein [Saprospiraceae bacterium]